MATATDVQNRIEYEHPKDAIDALDARMRQEQCEGHAGRWKYRDPEGEIIAQLFRYDIPVQGTQRKRKTIRWISRVGDGWSIGPPATPWPLYLRDDLGSARRVYLVGNEACADELRALGLTATTSACGAKAVDRTDWSPLAGKEVIILTGEGKADRAYRDVVTALLGKLSPATAVKMATVDGTRDVRGWLAGQRGKGVPEDDLAKRIQEMADDAKEIERPNATAAAPRLSRGAKALATRLVKYALEELDLFHTPEGSAYATMKAIPRATCTLTGKLAKQYLRRLCYIRENTAPSGAVIQTAINTLESLANFVGAKCPVFTRLAGHDGNIYLDLGDENWRAVRVGPEGWIMVEDCPVRFQRSRGMLPLPVPHRGGNFGDLWSLLNISSEDDRRLIVAWLICALRPTGPYPVLCLHGEQGAAKSTTAALLRALVDPNTAPLRSAPREGRDLCIAATHGWVLAFDNLSHLSPWLSDALCRLATGGGNATRELYTDTDEILFNAQRPIIMNGIEDLATRGDLLDRCLIVTLPAIKDCDRRPAEDVMREFEERRPAILGALLDVVAQGLRRVNEVKVHRLPRMADAARWVTACEWALGWEQGSFVAAYERNRRDANELVLEDSPVVPAIRRLFVERSGRPWVGTPTELLEELCRVADDTLTGGRDWPRRPNALSGKLRRLAPNLRRNGISFQARHTGENREITLSYAPPERPSSGSLGGKEGLARPRKETRLENVANDPNDPKLESPASRNGRVAANERNGTRR